MATSASDAGNVQYKVILGTVFGVVIANVAVLLRLLARKVGHITLKLDDYLICCALVVHWGIAIAGIFLLQYGLGLPITSHALRPVQYAKVLFSGTFLYAMTIFFTKTSILCLYYRVFTSRIVRVPVYITGIVVCMWALVCCVAGAFLCVPLKKLWDPSVPGTCFDVTAFYVGLQIPNVVTDVAIFLLPLPAIRTLPLPSSQKWSLVAIFGVGLLTVIFDIIRLVVMVRLTRSTEAFTLSQVEPSVWTCVEPAVGILAGCLSNMRPLLRYLKPWKSETLRSESETAISGENIDETKAVPRDYNSRG